MSFRELKVFLSSTKVKLKTVGQDLSCPTSIILTETADPYESHLKTMKHNLKVIMGAGLFPFGDGIGPLQDSLLYRREYLQLVSTHRGKIKKHLYLLISYTYFTSCK